MPLPYFNFFFFFTVLPIERSVKQESSVMCYTTANTEDAIPSSCILCPTTGTDKLSKLIWNVTKQTKNNNKRLITVNVTTFSIIIIIQFSPVLWLIDRLGCHNRRDDSAEILFSLFCKRPLLAVLTRAGMSTLWCCPSSIYSADHGTAHPPTCPEGWF